MMTADELVTEARKLIGTPFHHQGREPGVGIDCGGVIVHLMGLCGIEYDIDGYSRIPTGDRLKRHCDAMLENKSKYAIEAGDVLLFSVKRDPQHIGLCAGRTMIHAWYSKHGGSVIETTLGPDWINRLVAAYRIPGVS